MRKMQEPLRKRNHPKMPVFEARRMGVRLLLQALPVCDARRDGARV